MDVGNTLKEAREERGLSLEAAEEGTKIRRKYLEAMENEQFEVLPGRVYVKGFMRNYARFLGLDADDLVACYEELFPAETSPIKVNEPEPVRENRYPLKWQPRFNKYVAAAIGIALLFFIGTSLVGGMDLPGGQSPQVVQDKKTGPATPENTTGREKESRPNNEQQVQKPPVENEGVNLVLNVTEDRSWMQVAVDGNIVFTGFISANESKSFSAQQRISVRAGNAGVVQAQLNGEDMGLLGARGDVVTKDFPPTPQG